MQVYGNWADSSLVDETIIFFEFLRPDLINTVKMQLNGNSISTISDLLNRLRGFVPNDLYGLLNLSLSLRYFHPRASITNPIDSRKPTLSGYSVALKSDLSTVSYSDFHLRFLSQVYDEENPEKKLLMLRTLTHHYPKYVTQVSKYNISLENTDELYSLGTKSYSLINGRVTDGSPHKVIDALIEEYQSKYIMRSINISNIDDFLYSSPYNRVYTYIPSPDYKYEFSHHDLPSIRGKNSKEFKIDPLNMEDFMRHYYQISYMTLFISLKSKESLPALREIVEITKSEAPYLFYVYMTADMNNMTEKHISYAFAKVKEAFGARSSIKFLIDGFNCGFQKAYGKLSMEIKWKDIPKLYENSSTSRIVNNSCSYCKQYNISNFTFCVNGNCVKGTPSFLRVKEFYFENVKRIHEASLKGRIYPGENIDKWLENNSLVLKNSHVNPLDIDETNFISLAGLSNQQIVFLLKTISHLPSFHVNHDGEFGEVPVIYINEKPNFKNEDIPSGFPRFDLYLINSNQIHPEMKHTMRIENHPQTIVGPCVFDHSLSMNDLEHAIQFVRIAFMNCTNKLNSLQVLFILLWRSTQASLGIHRFGPTVMNSTYLIEIGNENDPSIKWDILMDPFVTDFRPTIEMAVHVGVSGAGAVRFLPLVSKNGIDKPPPYAWEDIYFMIQYHSIAVDAKSSNIYLPSSWAYRRYNNSYLVEKIVASGFCPGAPIVQLGLEKRIPIPEFGYFSVLLPVGTYKTSGLMELQFSVNTLIPKPQYYRADKNFIEHNEKSDNCLNIMFHTPDRSFENITLLMLSSILDHSSLPVKLWIVGGLNIGIPKGFQIEIIPPYLPHFINPSQEIWNFNAIQKYSHLDCMIPIEITNILLVDFDVVFQGDPARFAKLSMDNASVAAILARNDKKTYWNERDCRMGRLDKPYHKTKILWFNLKNWRDQKGSYYYRKSYTSRQRLGLFTSTYDEEVFNTLQLYTQFVSLPNYLLQKPEVSEGNAIAYISSSAPESIDIEDLKTKSYYRLVDL